MTGPFDLIRAAAVDADRAETLYQDPSFRSELRDGASALRTFEVTALAADDGSDKRQVLFMGKLRLAPVRVRPLL